MVVDTCNPSKEAKAGELLQFRGQPRLQKQEDPTHSTHAQKCPSPSSLSLQSALPTFAGVDKFQMRTTALSLDSTSSYAVITKGII